MVTIYCGGVAFHRIEAVIFDKDGTLADSGNFLRSLAQKRARLIDAQIPGVEAPLLLAFGLDRDRLSPAGLMAVGTRQENEVAAAAYIAETGRDWIEAVQIARSAFLEADQSFRRKAEHTPLFEGALDFLNTLVEHNIKLAIVSSDSPANVQDFVNRYQLNALFSITLGAELGFSKPDPAPLHQACERLGVRTSATLVIGDSAADVEMARAAAAAGCIGVTWGWTESLPLKQADAVVQSFAEIHLSD